MKKTALIISFTIAFLSFVACGNKNNKVLNKYEKLVDKQVELIQNSDELYPTTTTEYMNLEEQKAKVLSDINLTKLNKEQQERLVEINAKIGTATLTKTQKIIQQSVEKTDQFLRDAQSKNEELLENLMDETTDDDE